MTSKICLLSQTRKIIIYYHFVPYDLTYNGKVMLIFPTPAFIIEQDITIFVCIIISKSNTQFIPNILYFCKINQSNLNTHLHQVSQRCPVQTGFTVNEVSYVKKKINKNNATYRELLHALCMMDTEWFHVFQEVYLRNIQIRPKSLDNIQFHYREQEFATAPCNI